MGGAAIRHGGTRAKRALALPFCAALLASSPTGAAPKNARYVDRDAGFSFQPPDGWLRKAGLPRPLAAYVGPTENGFAANFSVNLYANRVEKGGEQKFIDSVKIEHGEIYERKRVRLAGKPAWAWRTRLTVPNYPTLENRMVVCFHNGQAYELTFTMHPALKTKYDPVYNRIAASFRFEGGAEKSAPKPKR